MNNLMNVLRKGSKKLEAEKEVKRQRKNGKRRSWLVKRKWIRWHENYSTNKYQVSIGNVRTVNTMESADRCDHHEASTSRGITESQQTPREMPDFESIIHEFEEGYRSPSKRDRAIDGCKQPNFVKKIVAAFEVKCKIYNEWNAAQEARESQEKNKSNIAIAETSKRRSRIFSNLFKSDSEEPRASAKLHCFSFSKQNSADADECDGCHPLSENNSAQASKRRSRIFNSLYNSACNEGKDATGPSEIVEHQAENEERTSSHAPNNNNKLEGPRSCCRLDASSSEICSSLVELDRRDSRDSSSNCSKFDRAMSSRRADTRPDSAKTSTLNETTVFDSLELDVVLSEESFLAADDALPKTSSMINYESPKSEYNFISPEISRIDGTPKIVGAFLKKPIEVDDTSIDWIPVTGKKLPRKRSLKKLLRSLAGKKLEKMNKLFSSERNLSEQPREILHSGYDESSSSSTSLTSLISITELLHRQENSNFEFNKKSDLITFKPKKKSDEEEDEAFCGASRSVVKQRRKQLLLKEVPRENVKLDLGPAYPSSELITMSLNRKKATEKPRSSSPLGAISSMLPKHPHLSKLPKHPHLSKLPKHPHLSKIPKHPFVALSKMDNSPEFNSSYVYRRSDDLSSFIIKNDLYEVEFQRSCDDLPSSDVCRSSSSAASHYDVPRRFLSKSENEILSMCQSKLDRKKEVIYDIPKSQTIERPKSSIYEDALSLKRRSIYMGMDTDLDVCSLAQPNLKFQYNSVSNTQINLNNRTKSSSWDDLSFEF